MGRNRLPTEIKERRGTLRPSREAADVPTPPLIQIGTPPPTWIHGTRRRRLWVELVELLTEQRIASSLDIVAVGMLVDAVGDYLEASDLLAGKLCGRCGRRLHDGPIAGCDAAIPGQPYFTSRSKDGTLMIRAHPAVMVRDRALTRTLDLLGRFGMSPADRSKVARVLGDPDELDPDTDTDRFFR